MDWNDATKKKPRNGRSVIVKRENGEIRSAKANSRYCGGFVVHPFANCTVAITGVTHWKYDA